jgi:hypothetical protein
LLSRLVIIYHHLPLVQGEIENKHFNYLYPAYGYVNTNYSTMPAAILMHDDNYQYLLVTTSSASIFASLSVQSCTTCTRCRHSESFLDKLLGHLGQWNLVTLADKGQLCLQCRLASWGTRVNVWPQLLWHGTRSSPQLTAAREKDGRGVPRASVPENETAG